MQLRIVMDMSPQVDLDAGKEFSAEWLAVELGFNHVAYIGEHVLQLG